MKKPDFKRLFADEKIKRIIIISGVLGIALIFLSSFFELPDGNGISNNVSEYKEQMQTSITEMLSMVEGVGNASVLLTIENSVEGVYLQNSSTKTKEIEPKIRGIVVACSGGDDSVVVARVTEIVTKALNISAAKVCVTKLEE